MLYQNKFNAMKAPSCSDSHRLDFVTVCKKKLEILNHPVYLSISLDSFIEKKFEYSEHTLN